VKAQHIAVFNTEHLSSMFERVIIASGTSNRQTKALAASVRDAVKSRGFPILSTEGEDNGEWIIVDCGAAVAHIMQPPIREYYHLEEIWGGKSVRMKVGEVSTKLVKASEPEPAPRAASKSVPKSAPKKPAARKPAVKQAAPAKSGSRSAGKAPAKSPTRKAADKSAAYQRVGARRPTGKTTMSTKTVARKTPARKAPRSA
jgi:ribosome-associated protein